MGATDANALVQAGALLGDSAPDWLEEVGAAVSAAEISVGAASAIAAGLGQPTKGVSAEDLARAAGRLTREARSLTPERVARLARGARTQLDEAGIADREAQRRARRFLTLTAQSDGMTRISGLLDPESAALVVSAIDAVTAPRRGGPRFVDPDDATRAQAITDDERTTSQLALDALVEMIRVAGLADSGRIFGSRGASVRVHVAARDLERGVGAAYFEGQPEAVSVATARRHVCESGSTEIAFDSSGQPIDVGRTQRLFTQRQRVALAARDGGCVAPGCDRPPSWCEAHHIDEWQRHRGRTDVASGVLLCRHHHLLVHNSGWRVRRNDAHYWMERPGERIELASKQLVAH